MRDNRGAFLLWAVAGIPLVLSVLQAAVVGLAGTDTAGGILLLPGLYEVTMVTETSGVAVAGLCLLAIGCWLGQGGSLFARGNRRGGIVFAAGAGVAVFLTFGLVSLSAIPSGAIVPLGKAGLAAIIVVGGVVGALALTPRLPSPDTTSGTDHGGDRPETVEPTDTERESIDRSSSVDSGTLDRIERIAPEAVQRIREQQFNGGPTEGAEAELYRGIESAIADGRLDPTVTSEYGGKYEIVNLPSRFREIELPMIDGRVHVREVEKQVRSWIDDDEISLRELAFAIEAILDHRDDIERYVRTREEEFDELRSDIESDIDSIRSIAAGLDGTVGDRTRMLVLEDRHDSFDGVGGVETRVSKAKSDLHRCAFGEATQRLRTLRSDTDGLLTAVDFTRSLIGGIEHDQRSARIPNPTTEQLYIELEPLFEQQYDVTLSLGDGRVSIERDGTSETEKTSTSTTGKKPNQSDDGQTHDTVEPREATDEILYILRELDRTRTADGAVEYQTEQLPDGIATHAILETLAAFCRRQTDIVAEVTLQADAPPGFFEIKFTGKTDGSSGIDELSGRFIDRYGSADR